MSDAIWSNISNLGNQVAQGRAEHGHTRAEQIRISEKMGEIDSRLQKIEVILGHIKWWTAALIAIIGTAVQFRAFLMSDSATKLLDGLGSLIKILGT